MRDKTLAAAIIVAGWTLKSSVYVVAGIAMMFSLYAVIVARRALILVSGVVDDQAAAADSVAKKAKSLLGDGDTGA